MTLLQLIDQYQPSSIDFHRIDSNPEHRSKDDVVLTLVLTIKSADGTHRMIFNRRESFSGEPSFEFAGSATKHDGGEA